MTRLLFVSYIFHCFSMSHIKTIMTFVNLTLISNVILHSRRYVKLTLLIVDLNIM